MLSLFVSTLLAAGALANPLEARQAAVTSVVNFASNTGNPLHLASGTLYGIPDNPNQIPNNFYTDMGWNYLRAGGAQVAAPGRGWIWGVNEYRNRFNSVLSNYRTAMQHNAKFIFLIHDLWGADGRQNSSAPYPGDNGNWASWDNYLNTVIQDMRNNNMLSNMIIDIWNEPDLSLFWNRNQNQYLQMWQRTFGTLRQAFGTQVLISGPATAGTPLNNNWWNTWASFIASTNTVPDQYAWHMEGGGGDLTSTNNALRNLLASRGLPTRPVNINEYAVFNEQVPSGTAWFIAQLERINAVGLRGNWLGGTQLHDFMASLLSKPNVNCATCTGYFPNGDYQVYRYYNQRMTGHRVATTPSGDLRLDSYATVGNDRVARVLVGVRPRTGTWQLQLNGLNSLGLPTSGNLNVHTWGFPVSGSNVHTGQVNGPNDLGTVGHPYSGNSVTFPVFQTDTTTAYAFEFSF